MGTSGGVLFHGVAADIWVKITENHITHNWANTVIC